MPKKGYAIDLIYLPSKYLKIILNYKYIFNILEHFSKFLISFLHSFLKMFEKYKVATLQFLSKILGAILAFIIIIYIYIIDKYFFIFKII